MYSIEQTYQTYDQNTSNQNWSSYQNYSSQSNDKMNFIPSTNNSSTSVFPTYFTTQKLSSSTTKLSYTPYQLELLNSIYDDMKYPNSVQKTLIAKRIGITRDQVKIWFQNRRRKDTINAQTQPTKSIKRNKSEDDDSDEQSPNKQIDLQQPLKSLVNNQIIEGVLNELRSHKHAPSRLSSKRSKLSHNDDNLSSESQLTLNNAETISDSQILKKTPNNCIIDLCPIINKSSSSSDISKENISPPLSASYQQTTNDYYIANTSSHSSTSFTTPNSLDENTTTQESTNYIKYQTLQQPMSISSYLTKKYYPNYYYQPEPQQQLQDYQPQWSNQQLQHHHQQQIYQHSNYLNYQQHSIEYNNYMQSNEYTTNYYNYS